MGETCDSRGCGCEAQSCGCGSEGCSCDFYEGFESRLMQMALFAHKSALFERIRERIEKQEGEKLDKIADLVVETAMGRFKDAQEAERKRQEIRDKLREMME